MTNTNDPPAGEPEELQFDHAEFATEHPPALACASCTQPITDSYFELNRNLLCGPCRERVIVATTGGSKLVRFFRACLFGGFAALAGAALYFLVAAVTGLHIGLIAILVGFMVGKAVSKGAHHRGGLIYQLLAVFLTYTAIVSAYVPTIWDALLTGAKNKQTAVAAAENPAVGGPRKADVPVVKNGLVAQKADRPKPEPGLEKISAGRQAIFLAVAAVIVMAIAYATPFLQGAEHIVTLFIIFFGLMQAWQLNRKVRLTINGPYQVGGEGPPLENAVHA